jgi:hypothetical protein
MIRKRKEYIEATKKSEQRLISLSEETGGKLWLLEANTAMADAGRKVAREIGAQYVVTYKPKRPLAAATPGEYRRNNVALRRGGLTARARKGYIVTAGQ